MIKNTTIPVRTNELHNNKVCEAINGKRIKHAACLFFVHFLLFYSSYAQLTAFQKAPATAAPGASFIVKLSINRGAVDGFMKFSQALPEGYTALEIDSKNGDFRFENNETKIIWLKAPQEKAYTVSYKIKVPEGANGVITLTGKIVYVTAKNERKVFDFPAEKITISKTPGKTITTVAKSNETEVKPTIKEKKDVAIAEKKTTQPAVPPAVSNKVETTPLIRRKNFGFLKGGQEPAENELDTWSHFPLPQTKFRVQIGAFRQPAIIKNVPDHSTLRVNEITKHFSGSFATYEQATERKTQMIEKGYKDAFIVEFPTSFVKQAQNHVCKSWWNCSSH